jgi:hypothetical protein
MNRNNDRSMYIKSKKAKGMQILVYWTKISVIASNILIDSSYINIDCYSDQNLFEYHSNYLLLAFATILFAIVQLIISLAVHGILSMWVIIFFCWT